MSHIETPEQITLPFVLAGVPSRAFAYMLDVLIQVLPMLAVFILLVVLAPESLSKFHWMEFNEEHKMTATLLAEVVGSLVIFCVSFGYFLLFEILWRGQTPGKRVLGLRVMRDGGYPIEPRAALVRNLLRAVDFLPGLYGVGMATVFWGRAGKRLGDFAAGTMVVREMRPKAVLDALSTPASRPRPTRLLAQEVALIENFQSRMPMLEPAARERVATLLAQKIAQRLKDDMPTDAQAYLQNLLHHDNNA